MRVVLVTHWMPWDRMGGTEMHVHRLAQALARRPGVEVVVLSQSRSVPPADVAYECRDLATPWLRFLEGRQAKGAPLAHLLHERALNRRAARLALRLRADVLHRHGITPAPLARRRGASRRGHRGPTTVLTIHRSNLPRDDATPPGAWHRLLRPVGAAMRRLRERGMRQVLTGCDAVVAVSDHAVRHVVARLGATPRRLHVVSNGCPADVAPARAKARKALGLPARARVVLFVGRLQDEKAPLRLLPLLAEPDVHLALAGSGPLLGELRARASAEPRLHVPGFLDEAAKAQWMAAADVVALPSGVFETQPIVFLEALRAGTPVYGTYDEWLPAELRRFGRFGPDVRLALAAMRLDAGAATALVPSWDDVAGRTLAVYRAAMAQGPGASPRARRGV